MNKKKQINNYNTNDALPILGPPAQVAKSAYQIRHFRQTVRLSPCINSAPSGRLFVKSDIGDVYENMSKIQICLKSGKNQDVT